MTETNKVNTGFRSNSAMALHYIRELLSDWQKHSKSEILEYVHTKTGGIGVSGGRITDETIASALWSGIRRNKADYEQTSKGWYQKRIDLLSPLNTEHAHKQAIYFLVEQARCSTQAACTDAQIYRQAAEFLINGDGELMIWLKNRMDVKPFEEPLMDYDIEEFEGKLDEVKHALTDLRTLAADTGIPQEKRMLFGIGAEAIADFYGEGILQTESMELST